MTTKFFYKDASGNKADVERHRKQEQELEEKITKLEAVPLKERDQMTDRLLRTYRHFLYQLHVSKAEVVSKIGKKK
jgi:hypothetical protein